eukprot:scaffold46090_cov18-Tisochrysis_lutea.AAC.3
MQPQFWLCYGRGWHMSVPCKSVAFSHASRCIKSYSCITLALNTRSTCNAFGYDVAKNCLGFKMISCTVQPVTDSFFLLSEVAHATQVSLHVLLCGNFNAKVYKMSKVLDMHDGLLMAHPALQQAHRCECSATNAAGRQLIELANVSRCVLGMGKVLGDNGQSTCLGHARGQGGSKPDHHDVVMSEKVFRATEQVDFEEVRHINDHCTMRVSFQVSAASLMGADWAMNCDH